MVPIFFLFYCFFSLWQKSFEALTHLDLFNNDICNIEDYRTKVFKLLPNLKFLDDADADDNDEEESDDEGANGAEEGDEDDGEGENISKKSPLISREILFHYFLKKIFL